MRPGAPAQAQPGVLWLRRLTRDDESEARAAQTEFGDDFRFLPSYDEHEPWAQYLRRLESHRQGRALPVGVVASTFLVAEADGRVVGRVAVRHRLNDRLRWSGGHIGYCVRPEFRGQGFATAILAEAIKVAAGLGLEKVLVTCDDHNVASVRVIERCGGVPERGAPGDPSIRRYWIRCTPESRCVADTRR